MLVADNAYAKAMPPMGAAEEEGRARARHLNGKRCPFAGAVRSTDKLSSWFFRKKKKCKWKNHNGAALLFPTGEYVWRRLPYATPMHTQQRGIGSYKFAFVYQLWNGISNFVFILASIIRVVAESPLSSVCDEHGSRQKMKPLANGPKTEWKSVAFGKRKVNLSISLVQRTNFVFFFFGPCTIHIPK